jgi:hypothetical protein
MGKIYTGKRTENALTIEVTTRQSGNKVRNTSCGISRSTHLMGSNGLMGAPAQPT